MEAGGQPAEAARVPQAGNGPRSSRRFLAGGRVLRARDLRIYGACDNATEGLVYLMVVFSPWAFGTTQPWSIWTMNIAGYALGLLLALKSWVRWVKGYRPSRWGGDWKPPGGERRYVFGKRRAKVAAQRAAAGSRLSEVEVGFADRNVGAPGSPRVARAGSRGLTATLAWLTVAIVAYCLISAVNARSTYRPEEMGLTYHDHFIKWLPCSLDSGRTWTAFWTYLGLACSFWAVWDWLLGKSHREQLTEYAAEEGSGAAFMPLFPARLRRLLWVMAVNGGLLGLEGIVQRLEGSGNLLFVVKPHVNPEAETQFGPYAYRGNAAAYLNLLWPVCLGFWWTLHHFDLGRRGTHHLLLACAGVMAACPVISTSRAGTIVGLGMLVAGTVLLAGSSFLFDSRRPDPKGKRGTTLALVIVFCCAALALGFELGWSTLQPRMGRLQAALAEREEMYEAARPMAADYPVFGTGPGTFETVFQFYRASTRTYWPAQAHNDWLETRITFGWTGSALIGLALATVLARWFVGGGIRGGRRFVALVWLALAGCLVHARYDFPFQIHSILFLFLVLGAILFNLARKA